MKRIPNRVRSIFAALALVAALALGLAAPALAAEFRGEDVIVIAADEIIDDDLFAAGNRVEINGVVKGDVFAAGAEVIVNGTVAGSLFAGAQLVEINGNVEGSVYGAGYSTTLGAEAEVARNVFFTGFSLAADAGSAVGRSVYGTGYQFLLNGDIDEDVIVAGDALELNGRVGGDVSGEVSAAEAGGTPTAVGFPGFVAPVAPGLRVGSDAEIGGDVDVEITSVEAQQETTSQLIFRRIARAAAARFGELIALLIVGGLFLWLWPDAVDQVGAAIRTRLVGSAGHGLVVFFAFWVLVIAAIVLLALGAAASQIVTLGQLGGRIAALGGGSIFLATAAFLFVVALVTKAAAAIVLGKAVVGRLQSDTPGGRWAIFLPLLVGAIVYEIVRAVPLIGFLAGALVTLVGLGAIYLALRQWVESSAARREGGGAAVNIST